jgi:peroxiredoxin
MNKRQTQFSLFARALKKQFSMSCLPAILAFCQLSAHAIDHPILPIGSKAPDFALPGVDGQTHKLSDYDASPILAVVFTCNHCPIAQIYEQRIQAIADDYKSRGVALVAIEPNDPQALSIDELDSSDISDSLAEMKMRVAYKHLTYPYLYDGDTQIVSRAYGPTATPHIFIFDRERKLRYEGRIDNTFRLEQVKTHYARDAIDALLAGKEPAVTHTGADGCSTKWSEKSANRISYLEKIEAQPVTVELASKEDLALLRTNPTHKIMLVTFWATWCPSCVAEFADLQDTFRMYQDRELSLVTVSANIPNEQTNVLHFLQKKHATSRNLLFGSDDTVAMQKAFDPEWDSAVPYTVLLSADGKVLYKKIGSVDIIELRRTILSYVMTEYSGFLQYWQQK